MLQLIKTIHLIVLTLYHHYQMHGSVVIPTTYIFIRTTMCTVQLQLKYFVHKETNKSLTKKYPHTFSILFSTSFFQGNCV